MIVHQHTISTYAIVLYSYFKLLLLLYVFSLCMQSRVNRRKSGSRKNCHTKTRHLMYSLNVPHSHKRFRLRNTLNDKHWQTVHQEFQIKHIINPLHQLIYHLIIDLSCQLVRELSSGRMCSARISNCSFISIFSLNGNSHAH